MRRVKICLVGSSAVGKTSLVARYVRGVFSDSYRTTIGITVDRRTVQVEGESLDCVLWDLEGEDAFARMRASYLRGLSGCLFVADGTRSRSIDDALRLAEEVQRLEGEVPRVLVLNKVDLPEGWEDTEPRVRALEAAGWQVLRASAKTGEGVDRAFEALARRIVEEGREHAQPSP